MKELCCICFTPGTKDNPLVNHILCSGLIEHGHKHCFTLENVKKLNTLEKVKQVYRNVGYDIEKDFTNEYYYMFNSTTGQKVRIYYHSGKVQEYR